MVPKPRPTGGNTCMKYTSPLRLLSADTAVGVGNTDAKDLGPVWLAATGNIYALLEDLDAVLATHVVRNLGRKRVVVPVGQLKHQAGTYMRRRSTSFTFATTRRRKPFGMM